MPLPCDCPKSADGTHLWWINSPCNVARDGFFSFELWFREWQRREFDRFRDWRDRDGYR